MAVRRVHVAVIMDEHVWRAGESQFRYYGTHPWTDTNVPEVDLDFLHAMVKLAIATGTQLKGELFTVIRMVMDAHTERLGAVINNHDYGPMVFVTDAAVDSRIKFERYLDGLPYQQIKEAYAVGSKMHRAIRKATNNPI